MATDRVDRKGIRHAGLVFAAILVGCTVGRDEGLGVQEQIEGLAKADSPFVGMNQEALRNCAGAPHERFGTDPSVGLEQWVYYAEPPGPAASDHYCKATFSLKDGQVTNVVFTQRSGMRIKNLSKCSTLIEPCR